MKNTPFTPNEFRENKNVLPIKYEKKEKRNKNKVQVVLRNRFDVHEYISTIHRKNEIAMNRFMINSTFFNQKKAKNQSYSITHQIIDVFDHLKEDKSIKRQNDYFFLDKKQEPNKLLNTMTTRFNRIVKKEREKTMRNEVILNTKGIIKEKEKEGLFNGFNSNRIKKLVYKSKLK